jgi:hypothetical protein
MKTAKCRKSANFRNGSMRCSKRFAPLLVLAGTIWRASIRAAGSLPRKRSGSDASCFS